MESRTRSNERLCGGGVGIGVGGKPGTMALFRVLQKTTYCVGGLDGAVEPINGWTVWSTFTFKLLSNFKEFESNLCFF